MKLAKPIFDEQGRVLLNEHVELTSKLIERLRLLGIEHIYIVDKRTEDLKIVDPVRQETKVQALRTIRENFRKLMEQSNHTLNMGSPFLGKSFRAVLDMIIEDLSAQPNAMIMISEIGAYDNYLYNHSLNVCIYAVMLGMACGYNRDQLVTFGLGALLHDIGKIKIPQEILKKTGKLTKKEFEIVKKHAEIGYMMLKDEPNIPLLSAHCAYQHHERLDGSGYPRGLKGDEIHEYGKWMGIIDTYDAMTNQRVYRKAMLPHQALEVLYAGAGKWFDKEKVELFRKKIAIYPLGSMVQLNTGETGVVVDINSDCPDRPIVRILEDQYGQSVIPYEIDLSKKMTVMIVSVNQTNVGQPQKEKKNSEKYT